MSTTNKKRIQGALAGLAVGDALGLPAEGLSRGVIRRLGWNRWRHRLILGRGMLSDDTEHALYTARCLIQADGDANRFAACLGWRLRWWLAGLPAGIGMATGRAIFKLWLGFPPRSSGVWSAGNGPAMRSPIIGAACAADRERMAALVAGSTRITHRDPKALTGAMAVAIGAAFGVSHGCELSKTSREKLFREWRDLAPLDEAWGELLEAMEASLGEGASVEAFADRIGETEGVSGYIYHTVPVALYAWLRHYGDFARALTSVLDLGGDTDTVGAITGALAGASSGVEGIPNEWIDGIVDYPRSASLIRASGEALAAWSEGRECSMPGYPVVAVFPRNLFFLAVVLTHGFMRLLPVALRRRLIP